MTNRKKIFSTDERKFGFIKICRAQIAALLGEDEEQALLARMLLCVQHHVFFVKGRVYLGKNAYDCFPGQWVTSYVQIAQIMKVSRKMAKSLLEIMQTAGWLKVDKLRMGCRIELNSVIASSVYRADCTGRGGQEASISDAESFYSKGYI